ncbi:tRNA pseudouridine(38-40) synthase TruA [Alphaproteobacteria bacterium]|nr:tRNA pseudouridine(38-40) synthase TruA [Alphaproteobacteria bacterium]
MKTSIMANIKLTIEYHGLPYCGWQFQKNEKTIQGEIEKAIFKFSGEKRTIQGAGRTDAGVHAIGQCASFELKKRFDDYQILNGINFHLGTEKIRVTKVENVSDEFNARFTAKSKIYNYQVFNSLAPSVIENDFSIHVRQHLDLNSMRKAIKLLLGKHDFSSFRAQGCQANKPIRTIDDASIDIEDKKIIFIFRAQSFLYQQIRIMVGSLLEVGLKNKNINWISELIDAKDRRLAGPTVPSKGLILMEISY